MKPGFDVLLVEDDRVVRESVARILRLESLRVDLAEDSASAVTRLRAAEHRVVVTDLALPSFSGLDLLDRWANDRPQTPVVLITGYATLENALRSFRRGAFDFLPKPFDVAELLGVTRRALRAAAARSWDAQASIRGDPPMDSPPRTPLYGLGRHSWAAIDDEVVTVGVAETFSGLMDETLDVRLPAAGELVTQGLACVEIACAGDAIHRVWSPLGGTVLSSNSELGRDPGLLNRAPLSAAWLLRIQPSDLAGEIDALTPRAAGSVSRTAADGKEKRWSSF